MKAEQLIRDPIFQLNLLLWMAKEQPPAGYVTKPVFYENGFRVVYIENPFPLPQATITAVQQSQREISLGPEPELLLGRMADKVALYFEAKANSFSSESTSCIQARGHLLAAGAAFAEVMAPLQSCLLCYVLPEDKRELMTSCLQELSSDLRSGGLSPGSHSTHGLAVVQQNLHYIWDQTFQAHTGVEGTSAVVLSGLSEDTDPSPLFLIYSDEDYPDAQNHDLLRRCVINQAHALLVCTLNSLSANESHEVSATSLLKDMTDDLFQYLGRKRQKAMRRLVTENVLKRIADFSLEKNRFPGVIRQGEVLKINFADDQAKVLFLEWLEDPKRTTFQASKPAEEPPSLFPEDDETEGKDTN